jgi:hypothetical protein
MVCRQCGTEIAAKAIICYKCGAATAVPTRPVSGRGPTSRRAVPLWAWALAAAIVAGLLWWRLG